MTDLRLLAPALAAWATSIAVLLGLSAIDSLESRNVMAGRVMVIAVGIAVVAVVATRRHHAVAVTLTAMGLASFAAAAQLAAWSSPALSDVMGEQVVATGVVNGPPRESLSIMYLPVSSTTMGAPEGRKMSIEVPISLAMPRFSDVPKPGTPVEMTGRLSPAGDSLRVAAYLHVDGRVRITGEPGVVDRSAQRVRDALHASLPSSPAGGAALVSGLAIGDENAMSADLLEQMRMSGLSHLTAVSGGNVAIVIGAVIALAWLLRLPMVARIAAALIALTFYVVVVHPEPSVLRAGVMGAVVVLSLLVGGRRPGPSVLATAVVILVVVVPTLSVSWGFALSVAATAGIVMLAPELRRRFEQSAMGARVPAPVVVGATLTVAAQVATAPVLLAMGAYVGIAAVPANLLAMPMVPIVTVAGLAAALIGLLAWLQPIAGLIAWVGAMAGEWIAQVAALASGIDVLRIRGSPSIAVVFVLASVVSVLMWRRGSPPARVSVIAGVAAVAILWTLAPPDRRSWPPAGWVMVQCDVGQGDGAVIAPSFGSGAVVIDTGVSARTIDRCLQDLGIEHIAALVLTHFHADHVNGLAGVVDGRRVDAVLSTIAREPSDQYQGVRHELQRRGLVLTEVRAGAQFRVGEGRFRVLWPERIITSGQVSSGSIANNASIVVEVRVEGLRLLLTGDIEPPAQAALLAEVGNFDVVKVPHHGSPHQHPTFAMWADADLAVISVGSDNSFGHPAPDTLLEWQRSGATIVRTDHHGDIAIVSDGAGSFGWVTRRRP